MSNSSFIWHDESKELPRPSVLVMCAYRMDDGRYTYGMNCLLPDDLKYLVGSKWNDGTPAYWAYFPRIEEQEIK